MAKTPPRPGRQAGADVQDPLLGRTINDRYRVVATLGKGGMGRVYKAVQEPLDRIVAIKVLAGGAKAGAARNFDKRLLLEAAVTAKLTHPNTVTVFDYGHTQDGIFFIAMEYLEGRTLAEVLESDGALAQERVIHIAQQICRSLREAHGMGVIHRDLKPANVILLQQEESNDFVKVLDFGLVKSFLDGADSEMTAPGTFMGSPLYLSPEQAKRESLDQRCDIYALGALTYHMLTGQVPFEGVDSVSVIVQHLRDAPVPPSLRRPDLAIGRPLEAVILRCLEKEPADRYQTMEEVIAALKDARTPHSAGGRPVPPSLPAMAPPAPPPPPPESLEAVALVEEVPVPERKPAPPRRTPSPDAARPALQARFGRASARSRQVPASEPAPEPPPRKVPPTLRPGAQPTPPAHRVPATPQPHRIQTTPPAHKVPPTLRQLPQNPTLVGHLRPVSTRTLQPGMAQGPIGAAGPQQARGNTAPPGADPQRPAAKASLRVTALARDGSRSADFALRPDETRVGKGVGEDELRLDDPFVAPLHAAFLFEEGQLSIEDKGTRNGVFLCVAQRFLEVGDELRIGRQRLRIDRMPRPDSAQAAAPTGGGPQPLWGSPDPGYRMQLVQVLERGGDGDTFPLRLGENQIGRGLGDVSFPGDGYVSGRHATLEVSDEGLRITDLGSANGTFVRLSRRTPVQQGDVLLIGDQLLRIDPS